MPEKALRMNRATNGGNQRPARPVMLAIAGDSASGKSTLTQGLIEALGRDRAVSIGADDYHRYDREERKDKPFTPLNPECNYVEIMEQHLQLLATGQPILKPIYDHSTGELTRPELIEPRAYIIVEGLLPLHTKLSRACFDIAVYLDPPEEIRIDWKLKRDTTKRGYEEDQVREELEKREPESEAFIRPQRSQADIVVRFAPAEGHEDDDTPLSAELTLRPTINHPNLSDLLTDDINRAMHLKLIRDADDRPVDALHVHGHASASDSDRLKQSIWDELGISDKLPEHLGELEPGNRSEPLAVTQLILLYHLLQSAE